MGSGRRAPEPGGRFHCFVDVATIRYSVPHRLVRRRVEVLVGDHEVVIFDGATEVARHARHSEPHERVVDPRHFDGLYRPSDAVVEAAETPIRRPLDVYAEAAKVTARGRERWTAIATRARESSERTRGKVRTVWREQVEGAKAGLARVKAALGRA